jgi:NAD(P)-dependent dehydrogenase (short-subunit alcohol dehydrogenase family)
MVFLEASMSSSGGAIYPDLQNKSVLVTGGGSGIGEAIVRAFARQKSKIGFIDINAEASRKLAGELRETASTVHFEHCDLTDISALRASVGKIREAHGPISILVNNAAHDERHKTEEVTPEYWDNRLAVNLKHQFFAAQAVLPDMKANGGGSIVNFGSTSWMVGQGGMAAYTAAKSAVLGLTRSLARDFGPFNVRVNAIAPGWIMTQRQIELWLTPEGEKELMQRQCLKRKLQPPEIAKFVLFLASEEASACTNQQYVVDGGWV